jgi:hypothetical protein
LEELFRPVAPTLQIHVAAGPPPEPAKLRPEDPEGYQVVAWQHWGIGLRARSI